MDLLTLVIVLILVGLGLYLVDQIVPDAQIRMIIRVVVLIVVLLWLVRVFLGGTLVIPRVGLG